MRHFSRTLPRLALIAWACAIVAGFRTLVDYELRAGAGAAPLERWPADSGLTRDERRSHLVMFAHPQCPCSRASIAELDAIMTRCGNRLKVAVCFFDPEAESEEWTRSALWRAAAAIPGVEVIADRDRRIAARFGSSTSGQAHLFDRDGRRLFSGGITGARGQAGENRGRNLVIALARGEACAPGSTPVFGCSLLEPGASRIEAAP